MASKNRVDRLIHVDGVIARRLVEAQSERSAALLSRLSNAANHSLVWMGVAGALAASGGRSERRAAMRGLVSVGIASAVSSGILKRLLPRERPPVPASALPSIVRRPGSSSFPSGHSASAAAFATAVAIENPLLGVPVGALAAGVAYSRITTGVHYPSDVVAGAVIGVTAAAVSTLVWPRVDPTPASARPAPRWLTVEPSSDGEGLSLVVNASAGPAEHQDAIDEILKALPNTRVVKVEDPAELGAVMEQQSAEAATLGVLGGDGTVGAAAAAALKAGVPLAVFPGGTLNHFARDLGVDRMDDAIAAVKDGSLVEIDTAVIDDRPFLNTASFGGYSHFVEARERYEDRIGKWPAAVLALVKVLRDAEPLSVELNGSRRNIWMIFIGNCSYDPPGFVPATRNRLDDGLLDVRYVDVSRPLARLRLVAAVLTGTLHRSKVYSRELLEELQVESDREDAILAADGETFTGHGTFAVAKQRDRLRTYAPHRP